MDTAWAHKQEEAFRLFAADEDEKRLRFPPMKKSQRAFLHSLAEDFGFDGESLDPEPNRHILIFKTPKFVAAPMKTLAQAARIRKANINTSTPVTSMVEKKVEETRHHLNGYLLDEPRFALTTDEIQLHLEKVVPSTTFDIIFLSSASSFALIVADVGTTAANKSTTVTNLQPALSAELKTCGIADGVTACFFDMTGVEPTIIHKKGQSSDTATNGWSKVAAKRSTPVQVPQIKPVGQRPVYTVLGSRLAEAKKKKQENEELLRQRAQANENVAEDWEQEIVDEHDTDPVSTTSLDVSGEHESD